MSDREPLDEEALARIAHQLKNPLAVILGYAELLQMRDDEETRQEAPVRISEAATLLSHVIDDLVIVLAVDSGSLVLRPIPLDLEQVVSAVVDEVRRSTGADHDVTVHSAANPWPTVVADADYLPRILMNVLLTACRTSPPQSKIMVEVAALDGQAEICVTDSGSGYSEPEIARAFERFTPTDNRHPGELRATGLELYNARRLVELHGGAISIESPPGERATIKFRIPLDPAAGP